MKYFTIIGPGAMGCYFSFLLKKQGKNVTLVDHDAERILQLNQTGIRIEQNSKAELSYIPVVSSLSEIRQESILIFCLKSYSFLQFLEKNRHDIARASALLIIQNGLSWVSLTEQIPVPAGGGICYFGITETGPGTIRFSGEGQCILGELSVKHRTVYKELTGLLNDCGLTTCHSDDILKEVWLKLIVNNALNPLTVFYNCPNGGLLDAGKREHEMKSLVKEGVNTAAAAGYLFDEYEVWDITRKTCLKTASNISSMLQDRKKGKQTEIEAITGEILRRAASAGISVPLCERLYRELKVS